MEGVAAHYQRKEIGVPALHVVGMEPLKPKSGAFEPLLLRVAEEGFDLGTDVNFAQAAPERRHERHGRDLFDKRPVLRFRHRGLRCGEGREFSGLGRHRLVQRRKGQRHGARHLTQGALRLDQRLGHRVLPFEFLAHRAWRFGLRHWAG